MSTWNSLPDSHPSPTPLAILTAVTLALCLFESILTVWQESPWNLAIPQVLILALAALWSLSILCSFSGLARPYRIRASPVLIPLAAPVGIGAIQLLAHSTIYRWNTWSDILFWTVCFAAFWLALQLGAHPAIRAGLLHSLLWFTFVFSALSVATFYTGSGKVFGFIEAPFDAEFLGPFSNRDHYAAFIELILPLALYQALMRPRRFYLGAVMAGMLYASVIAGASRAGSFLATLEVAVILFLAWRRRLPAVRRSVRPLTAILALAAALTIAAGYARLAQRLQEPDPYRGRYQMLLSAREMFSVHPIAGFGLGNFEIAYPPFARYDDGTILGHIHNDWVEWTLDGGLPLLLSLLAFAALSAPALWRSLWGLGSLSVLLHSLIDFPLHRPAISLWLFILIGLVLSRNSDSANPDF